MYRTVMEYLDKTYRRVFFVGNKLAYLHKKGLGTPFLG
jgi:hypothetical protein